MIEPPLSVYVVVALHGDRTARCAITAHNLSDAQETAALMFPGWVVRVFLGALPDIAP